MKSITKKSQYRGIAEAIVGKNRHGESGTAYMHAQLKYCQFSNLDPEALNEIQGVKINGCTALIDTIKPEGRSCSIHQLKNKKES